eukprot:765011-Hanusia_phi.AAC.1
MEEGMRAKQREEGYPDEGWSGGETLENEVKAMLLEQVLIDHESDANILKVRRMQVELSTASKAVYSPAGSDEEEGSWFRARDSLLRPEVRTQHIVSGYL